MQNATSMSLTDKLTREHKMTADEARLILNVGKDSGVDAMMKVSMIIHTDLPLLTESPVPSS